MEDFSDPASAEKVHVVQVPQSIYAPGGLERLEEEVEVGDRTIKVTEDRVMAPGQSGELEVVDIDQPQYQPELLPGQMWTVDSLIGQVNGRPIFADEFLLPIEARLIEFARMPSREQGRTMFVQRVETLFDDWVDSELIIAEAESLLTSQQKQGLFAWLQNLRESEIATRGGSSASAQQSIQDQFGVSMGEFIDSQKNLALGQTLLNRRVEPRSIVSWRDVLREYEKEFEFFNPPSVVKLGRIRIRNSQPEQLEMVVGYFQDGWSFSQVAEKLEMADGGMWMEFQVEAAGIESIQLADPIKSKLVGLDIDQASEPVQDRSGTTWFAILEIVEPKTFGIFDPNVQLSIRGRLKEIRKARERVRYIESLRSQWVTEDIEQMKQRLVDVALERYWR
ncbi:MAG: hypothetical protein CMJ32_09430 [Phycisphaerae bacterium]|nr:hypothetical protein [Phycisphaerae bacterium]